MAVSVTNQATPLGSRIVKDTDADATAKDNTTGTTGTLYFIEVDNSANSGAVFFKMADTTNATGGTTAADICLLCDGSKKTSYIIPDGLSFGNGFSHWCTTSSAEASTASPASNVTIFYVTS